MEHINKDTLLKNIQRGYSDFDVLLSSLNEQQMLTPEDNSGWTIKDHIAHFTAWQQRTLNMLRAIMDDVELADPTPGLNTDQINEQFYHQFNALPLDGVLAEHREMQQQMLNTLQAMSEEDINKPISWLDNRPVVEWVIGDTYEHYDEHIKYIQHWLHH